MTDPGGSNDAPERSPAPVDGEFVVAVTVTDPSVPDVLVVHVVSVGVEVMADAGVASNGTTAMALMNVAIDMTARIRRTD